MRPAPDTCRGPGGRAARRSMIPSEGREGEAVIRLGELVMILDLHRQGLSVSAIARQLERDRKTVRKYIEHGLEAPGPGLDGFDAERNGKMSLAAAGRGRDIVPDTRGRTRRF